MSPFKKNFKTIKEIIGHDNFQINAPRTNSSPKGPDNLLPFFSMPNISTPTVNCTQTSMTTTSKIKNHIFKIFSNFIILNPKYPIKRLKNKYLIKKKDERNAFT